jgi:flagellar M-ring protein FliF
MGDWLEIWRARLFKLRERWSKLTLNQKVLLLGALLLIVAALAFSTTKATNKNYQPLYTKMDINDAAAVRAKLEELAIPYQLADEGTTILVPEAQKYQARLQLASADLPKGVVGFELFDQTNFGETETDKKVKYQRALTGELTKTIESLDKVESSRVSLVIPEKPLFSEEEQPPTASVLIKIKAGQDLDKKEIVGIVHMVASSVEGLKPENVTVVDTEGRLLSANLAEGDAPDNTTELTQIQLAMKKKYEKDEQDSVQSMLEQILGPNKAVVRVSADLNFDEIQSSKEVYGPGIYPRSSHKLEETSTTTQQNQEGVPGTESNIPTYQEANTAGAVTTDEKTDSTINNEIDKEVIQRKFAQGDVKSITVSVIVDKDLDDQQKDDIKQAVETAVGIDRNNPDPNANANRTVSVVGIRFSQPLPVEPAPSAAERLNSPLVLVIALAVVILMGILLWILLRKRQGREGLDEESAGFEALVGEELKIEDLLERELSPEERERKRIRDEIEKLIANNPEDAANVLRMWLMEEGR